MCERGALSDGPGSLALCVSRLVSCQSQFADEALEDGTLEAELVEQRGSRSFVRRDGAHREPHQCREPRRPRYDELSEHEQHGNKRARPSEPPLDHAAAQPATAMAPATSAREHHAPA